MNSVLTRRVTVVCPMMKTALTKASHVSDARTQSQATSMTSSVNTLPVYDLLLVVIHDYHVTDSINTPRSVGDS